MKGKNRPSKRHRKKQVNIIEERKSDVKQRMKEQVRGRRCSGLRPGFARGYCLFGASTILCMQSMHQWSSLANFCLLCLSLPSMVFYKYTTPGCRRSVRQRPRRHRKSWQVCLAPWSGSTRNRLHPIGGGPVGECQYKSIHCFGSAVSMNFQPSTRCEMTVCVMGVARGHKWECNHACDLHTGSFEVSVETFVQFTAASCNYHLLATNLDSSPSDQPICPLSIGQCRMASLLALLLLSCTVVALFIQPAAAVAGEELAPDIAPDNQTTALMALKVALTEADNKGESYTRLWRSLFFGCVGARAFRSRIREFMSLSFL